MLTTKKVFRVIWVRVRASWCVGPFEDFFTSTRSATSPPTREITLSRFSDRPLALEIENSFRRRLTDSSCSLTPLLFNTSLLSIPRSVYMS